MQFSKISLFFSNGKFKDVNLDGFGKNCLRQTLINIDIKFKGFLDDPMNIQFEIFFVKAEVTRGQIFAANIDTSIN